LYDRISCQARPVPHSFQADYGRERSVRKLAGYRLGCRMAEDFDPCHFLDVAADAKFRFNIINSTPPGFSRRGSTSRTVKVWPGSNTILSNWLCSPSRESISKTRSMPTALAIAA